MHFSMIEHIELVIELRQDQTKCRRRIRHRCIFIERDLSQCRDTQRLRVVVHRNEMDQNRRWVSNARVEGNVDARVDDLAPFARISIFAQTCELQSGATAMITRHASAFVLTRLRYTHTLRQIAPRTESSHRTQTYRSIVDHAQTSRMTRAVALQLLVASITRPSIVTLTHIGRLLVVSVPATPMDAIQRI